MGMSLLQLQGAARVAAEAHGLDPKIVLSLCQTESSWRQYASRYEPGFYARYMKDRPVSDTERHLGSTSFGLMQIMGVVAREYGFRGPDLCELTDPVVNLEFGCRKLADCMTDAKGDVRVALLKYNGGGDIHYPDRVMANMKNY